MSNLTSVLNQLEQERTRLKSQIDNLGNALSTLNGASSRRRGRISAPGRARIAPVQRDRWARLNGRTAVPITAAKRTTSVAARKKIAAAQKARWAKWRKAQKKG